jgi:tight adherence protein B
VRLAAAALTGTAVWLLLSALAGRLPRWSRPPRPAVSPLQAWLVQAGSDLTPSRLVGGSLALAAVAFALLAAVTATPAVALVPAVAVAFLPRAHLGRVRQRRMRSLQEAWPDALRDLVAATSAGRSLHQGVLSLATDGPPALRPAFARYAALVRAVGVVPALELVRAELADPTSDRVLEVLVLAHERGGQTVTEILRDLADATTRDLRTLEEIHTEGLEQRINAGAVFVLPWLVLLALTLQDGVFRDFYGSSAGLVVIAIAAVLSLVGVTIVARLAREPSEPRVLAGTGPSHGGRA